jgi:hypothetical protein
MGPSVALLAVACASGETFSTAAASVPTPTAPTPPADTPSSDGQTAIVLVAGEWELPAARAFGQPGFHQVLTAVAPLPTYLPETFGYRLTVQLWDAGRPDTACGSEHPLSGCATVDWSDFDSRPNVPAGGVFDNHLSLETAGGERAFFLSESGVLADGPDRYSPG